MSRFLITEILEVCRGELVQRGERHFVSSVAIDSRRVKRGALFIAIQGHRRDGHRYIHQAAKAGTAALLVSHVPKRIPRDLRHVAMIVVKDTTRALGQLAAAHRARRQVPVIGVTGSAGKTTVKNMLVAVLSRQYRVLANERSENNFIGLPLTLLRLRPSHEVVVLEMGTNRPGDIRWLSTVAQPTMAVLTNIGESHLAGLGSSSRVFAEKIALVGALPPDSTVIFHAGDPYLEKIPQRFPARHVVRYGTQQKSDYQACATRKDSRGRIVFKVNKRHPMSIAGFVPENVDNALAAGACGRLFGMSYAVIARGLKRWRPETGRQAAKRIGRGWLIDDTYNANPVSVRSALATMMNIPASGPRIFVFGDMRELGPRSRSLHQHVGTAAKLAGIDNLIGFGDHAQYAVQAFVKGRVPYKGEEAVAKTLPQLKARLRQVLKPDAVILVKGSRAMKLERLVSWLETVWPSPGG